MNTPNITKILATALLGIATLGMHAQAALVMDFRGSGRLENDGTNTSDFILPGDLVITLQNLDTDPYDTSSTTTDPQYVSSTGDDATDESIIATGSLDLVGPADTFSMDVVPYTSYTLSGNDLTLPDASTNGGFINEYDVASNNRGWGVNARTDDAGEILTYTFDLSGLPSGVTLQLTGMVANYGSAPWDVGIVVDGKSHNTYAFPLGGLTFDIPHDIANGDTLGIYSTDGGAHLVDQLTFTAIPEPSTLALFALTGVAAVLGLRRRRS